MILSGGQLRRLAHAPGLAGHPLYLRGGTAPHACSRKSRKVEKRKNLGFSNGFEAGVAVNNYRILFFISIDRFTECPAGISINSIFYFFYFSTVHVCVPTAFSG